MRLPGGIVAGSKRLARSSSRLVAEANDQAGARFLAGFVRGLREDQAKRESFRQDMARRGVRFIHEENGWIDRERNTIDDGSSLVGAQVGDLVAIGDPTSYRVVRITRCQRSVLFDEVARWSFVEIARFTH